LAAVNAGGRAVGLPGEPASVPTGEGTAGSRKPTEGNGAAEISCEPPAAVPAPRNAFRAAGPQGHLGARQVRCWLLPRGFELLGSWGHAGVVISRLGVHHADWPLPSSGRLEEVPLEVLRQRESKWLDMLNNWDKWMAKKHKKIRLRCQKGIPPSLRGRAWQYLSGSKVKLEQNIGKFDELDLQPGEPKWLDVIERDLHRQFPFHEMFVSRGGHGQQDLFRVLKAYTLYRPEEGYCQAQAPIAAVLLMHMPAEQAFWCLVQICEKYLPGYYSEKLEAIQLDGQILFSLLHKISPVAYKHLSKQKIDPILYMTEWFMCAFSRTLPWSSVLRVWDMFFCEGVKIIFRVGLVLLKHTLGSSDKLKSCQGQYETMERLRALSPKIMQETFLVQEVRSS
ncbi:PREDICTED: TBC1 domain family member 10A-like, partial [Eurypyga helias]